MPTKERTGHEYSVDPKLGTGDYTLIVGSGTPAGHGGLLSEDWALGSRDYEFVLLERSGKTSKEWFRYNNTSEWNLVQAPDSSEVDELGSLRDQVVRLPPQPRERDRFQVLQKWEGTVTEINGSEFRASLRDLLNDSQPDEEMKLLVDEVSESDLPLLRPGGVFYWSIGYRVNRLGGRERVSAFRFRRLPVWTKRDLDDVAQEGSALWEFFGLDENPTNS